MSYSRLFINAALFSLLSLGGLYATAFNYQFGALIPAEYEVYKWILLKQHLAENEKGERLLLVGDSSVLFGFDGDYLQKQLGRPVINMGLHGALPLEWNFNTMLKNARKGDIVVAPITWQHYGVDARSPNGWFPDQMVAWGRKYFNEFPLGEKLYFVTTISPMKLYENMNFRMNHDRIVNENPLRELKPDDELLEDYFKQSTLPTTFSYSYLNLDRHGGIRNNCGVKIDAKPPVFFPLKKDTKKYLLDLRTKLEARGVKLYIVAQPSVDNPATRSRDYLVSINAIWDELKKEGLPVLGEVTDYFFPPQAFYDTDYHLNCEYSTERSKILVAALKKVL